MYTTGLVSISFRPLPPEQIIAAASAAGLSAVEWGSDVHAPCDAPQRLTAIADTARAAGIACCSYGTYYRLGTDAPAAIRPYIAAARTLGTDILRVWCGDKSSSAYTPAERAALLADTRAVGAIAREEGVTLCMECHPHTFTEDADSALWLMQETDNSAVRMYWQPNQYRPLADNLAYIAALAPYTTHLHVFHWQGSRKLPLAQGADLWRQYLAGFSGDRHLLLEFMPDDDIASLPAEAAALRQIIGGAE